MALLKRPREEIDECLSEADNTAYSAFSHKYIKTSSLAKTLITMRHKLAEWVVVLGPKNRWPEE